MIKIAVTGSIASGKTTVAKMLSGKKYLLFDADKEVKKIYKKKIFKKKALKKFGVKSKRDIKILITKKPRDLKKLEKIIHPLVRKELKNFSKRNKKKSFVFFEIPLLIESKLMSNFNKIIFVNSPKKIRARRFIKKDKNIATFEVLDKRQLRPAKKIKFCDFVINNNSTLKKLKKNVRMIQKKL